VKIKHRSEITGENQNGNEFRGGLPIGQRGLEWARAPGGEEPLDSVSCPFLSRDFSYLIKTIKILNEKVLREPFLTRTVTYSKTNSAGSCILSWMNSSGETV
jgi:hypothetical protein